MIKVVIAQALAASSAPTTAKSVPPFEVRCAKDSSDSYALTAKCDGQTFRVNENVHQHRVEESRTA